MGNRKCLSFANLNRLSTSSFSVSVNTWAGQETQQSGAQDKTILSTKSTIFFYFNPWIKPKPAFCTGNAERFSSLAAAESVTAKWQHISSRPNVTTSHFHFSCARPAVTSGDVREFDHTREGEESQKVSSRTRAHFPNSPGHHPCHFMLSTQLLQDL